jgi:glycosyltransferase involved in cell wall biosynthesis
LKLGILGPFPPFRGGIATFNYHLWTELRARTECAAWNYRRLYPGWAFPGQTQFDQSGTPFQTPAQSVFDPFRPWNWAAGRNAVGRDAPDVVLTAVWTPLFAPSLTAFLGRVRRRTGARLAAICHNVRPHEAMPMGLFLQRRLLRRMDTVVVHWQGDRETVAGWRRDQRVISLFHPLYERFPGDAALDRSAARARLGIPELAGKLLLFFGLVRPYKGLDILLESFRRLAAEAPDLRLMVAGEFYQRRGQFDPLLSELVRSGRLVLHDRFIPNEDVHLYFRAADLVVLPYRRATQSGVIPLAYQFGRGVVSTRVGGLGEMIAEGESGFLVPPDDPAALADAIRRGLAGQADLEARVGRVADRFRWPAYVDALLAALAPDAPRT